MASDRWRSLRDLFEAACDLPPSQWRPTLERLSADPALVEEAMAMLQAQTAGFERALQPLRDWIGGLQQPELSVGDQVGPWRLVERIASGGMGTVFVAERADGLFRQRVAIKLLRGRSATPVLEQRLAAERQILAELQHPNIARLHDGGTTPSGAPYLVMEYIDGQPLDAWCEARSPGLRERLALFLRICDAVQAAHRRLVVHCDLKPGNVLVRADGEPVLLDFGIARLLGEDADEGGGFCTPAYASPELLRGGAPVGTSSDVFSLGAMLGELLSRRRMQRPSRDPDAPVPLPSAWAGDDCPWKRLLRGDLDAIVARACAIDPQRRYASVQQLAADVDAWLQQRPVSAVRGGRGYHLRRFLQRHRLAAALAGLVVVALAGGLAMATWQARLAREQRDNALVESAKSRAMLDFMAGLFEQADPARSRGRELTARELLASGGARMRGRFRDQPEVRAELLGAMADAHSGLGYYEEALPLADEAGALARRAGATPLLHSLELGRARILHHLGRYTEALAVLEPLQAALMDAGPEMASLRAGVAHARALALQATNRLDEAEQAYGQALAQRRSAFGDTNRATQETALRLVSLYVLRKRMDEAERLARSTLATVRASTDEHDPHLADAIDALAMVLANTGPLHEAEALRREELAIREAAYGSAHPSTVGTRNDLAGVLHAQGRYDLAGDIYRDVLAARLEHYDDAHPAVATAANNLAVAQLEAGRFADALAPARQALAVRMAAYGPDHHGTATSLHTLGAIELELGDPAALDHLQRAVAGWEAAMGADSSSLASPLRDLARAQLMFGRPDRHCAAAERAWTLAASQSPERKAYVDAVRAACALAAGRPGAHAALDARIETLRGLLRDDDSRLARIDALAAAVRRPTTR